MAKASDVRSFEKFRINLGNKDRTIKFDLNSFIEMENRFDSVEKAMTQLKQGKMADVRTIMFLGLIHEETIVDPITGEPTGYNITPFQVGSWLTSDNLAEVSEKLGMALASDAPQPEAKPSTEQAVMGIQTNDAGEVVATIELTEAERAAQAKNA